MPTRRTGPRYTPEEARVMIPISAKRVALEAVDLVIALEKYPIDSHNVERRVWALRGQVYLLQRLCYVIWKYEALKKAATQRSS